MNQPAPQTPPRPPAPAADTTRWVAAVLPVLIIAACAELGIAVLNNSALPVYLTLGLKMDERLMGFVMVPFFISEALLKSPLGVLSDRYGRRPLMFLGALITVVTPAAFVHLRYHPGAATALLVLFAFGLLRLLDGIGQSALWPSLFAYIGDRVAGNKRGTAMGLLNVTYMIGLALSFLAGGFVDDTFGPLLTHDPGVTWRGQMHQVGHRIGQAGHHLRETIRHPHHTAGVAAPPPPPVPAFLHPEHYFPSFYLASALFAVAAIVALLALPSKAQMARLRAGTDGAPDAAGGHDEKISWAGFVGAVRTVPQFLLLAFVTFLGIGCLVFIVKLFAMQEFGLQGQQVGVLMLGPALFIAAVSVPVGQLADKWGKTRAVRLGFLLCAVGLWGIPILHHVDLGRGSTSLTSFIVSASVMGVGFVLAFPAWMALITSVADDAQRGTVFGAVSTAQGVGVLIGSLIGPALYHRHHIAPFVAAAILVTLGAVLALLFVRESVLSRPAKAPRA